MRDAIARIVENLLLTVGIAVVVFFLLVYALQRGRAGNTLRGMMVVVGSLLRGPYDYIKAALDQLADRATAPPLPVTADRQLLAKRLFFGSQLAVVLAALWFTAVGVGSGWTSMKPNPLIVDAYRAARDSVAAFAVSIPELEQSIAALNATWSKDSATIVNRRRNALLATVASSRASRDSIKALIVPRGRIAKAQLTEPIAELDATQPGFEDFAASRFQQRAQNVASNIRSLNAATAERFGFTAGDSALLMSYLAAWSTGRTGMAQSGAWPPANVRNVVQPEFLAQSRSLSSETSRRDRIVGTLPSLKEGARWKVERMAMAVMGALVQAFVLVWVAGFLVEIVWLFVDMADNLRRLRAHFEPGAAERPSGRMAAMAPPGHRPTGSVAGPGA